MGHRPENADKETTSPEISLLPSSDGLKRPIGFPEVGVKTSKSFSRSLDRSVSAPTLGSPKHSPAETVCPRGAKSVESLPESPATLGREELPLTLLNLSDRDAFTHVDASLAETEPSCNPSSPSLNTCAKPVASGNPKPSCAKGSGPGLESSVEETEGSCLPSSCLELSQTGPKPPLELGMEQSPDEQLKATRTPEHFSSAMAASPLPANGGQALESSLPGGGGAKDGKLTYPSCGGAQRPESAPHHLPVGETLMDVEVPSQALIAADSQRKEPNASLLPAGHSQAESPKPDSSLFSDPFSASDWKQSGKITFKSTDTSASVGLPGSPPPPEGQLSRQVEEACPSLASALKELHQLLVVSYKKASGNESINQPGTLPEDNIADEEILGGKQQECLDRGQVQDVELSSPEGKPCGVHGDASADVPFSGTGAEDGRVALELPDKGALMIEEPLGLDLNSSIVHRPAVSREPPGGECSETSPQCLSSGQTAGNEALEQNQPSSSLMQGGESQSVLNFPPREHGMAVSSSTGEPPALNIWSPQPPVFPSANIDQIVRAGFTPQEASEALERAGGEVDLALLILLAKKIVVPT